MPSGALKSSDRLLFLADQFADVPRDKIHLHPGGAELTDQAVLELAPCPVECRTFSTFTEQDLERATICIVGNASQATPEQHRWLVKFPRLILFEHDMRICIERGNMTLWKRPLHRTLQWCTCRRQNMLKLTRASVGVVFLTGYQRRLFERNPWYRRPPARVLGSSVFSKATLEKFRLPAPRDDRPIEICLSYSAFPDKGFEASMARARTFSNDPFVIKNLPPDEVLEVFRHAKRFVHIPPSPEWAGRLPVEARFMGCEVITNEHVGVALEPWWALPDEQALEVVSSAANRFWNLVDELLVEHAARGR